MAKSFGLLCNGHTYEEMVLDITETFAKYGVCGVTKSEFENTTNHYFEIIGKGGIVVLTNPYETLKMDKYDVHAIISCLGFDESNEPFTSLNIDLLRLSQKYPGKK